MKIVINNCWGGFGLSPKAIQEYLKLIGKECYFYKQVEYKHEKGKDKYIKQTAEENSKELFPGTVSTKDLGDEWDGDWNKIKDHYFYYGDLERTDENMIKVIEMLGEKEASGSMSSLIIVEIPDGVDYYIHDYDGMESVNETHRTWG